NQLRYWKTQLRGAPQQLELPTDRPRPAIETFKGAMLSFALSAALSKRLKELAQREGTTLFIVTLAAYQVLLARMSRQHDIVVGAPIPGRGSWAVHDRIGFFVALLVLRSNVSSTTTFRELLGRVKQMTLEAYAHQDLPFEALVKELRP